MLLFLLKNHSLVKILPCSVGGDQPVWSGVTGSSRHLPSALLVIPTLQGSAARPSANHSLSVPQLQDLQSDHHSNSFSLSLLWGSRGGLCPRAVPRDQPCPAVPAALAALELLPWLTGLALGLQHAEVTARRRAFISVLSTVYSMHLLLPLLGLLLLKTHWDRIK